MKKEFILGALLVVAAILTLVVYPLTREVQAEEELVNKSVLSCNVNGVVVRFYPKDVMFLLQGINGYPDGMVAKDSEGKVHNIFFTKDSPYKCAITEEGVI